jgi:esterase/lipase
MRYMNRVYCISGLGADERVFRNIRIPGADLSFIQWIQPVNDESIRSYAERLSIQFQEDNVSIIGLSFGGMMAIELSRIIKVKKIVLISSIKHRSELPLWMRTSGILHAEKLLPQRQFSSIPALRSLRPIQNYFLGVTTEEEKKIANEYRETVDPVYLKWSLNKVLNWKNEDIPANLTHIHGSNDHIFPLRYVKPTHVIEDGGHFMVMNKYSEINSILQSVLSF